MIKNSELYAIPLIGGGFVTVHVILSVEQARDARLVTKESELLNYGDLLVDVYGPPTDEPSAESSERLIHGIWTLDRAITGRDKPRWQRIGTRDVVPADVEFPELLHNRNEKGVFVRGEITRPTPYDAEEVDARTPFVTPPKLVRICTNLVGRGEALGEARILFGLQGDFDLRYNAQREKVYHAMGVDPARRYFEWATAEGLDPGRFWR